MTRWWDLYHSIGFSVLPAVLFLVSEVTAAPKCNDSDLRACMEELKVLTSNNDLAFAQTDIELKETCRHLKDAMQCVNNFTSRCFDTTQRDLYRQLTRGAQSLLTDLCTEDSDFRKNYLVHAGCYRNLSSDYRRCADNYLMQQENAKKEELPVPDRLRKSCCLFDGYKECTRIAVEEKCSKEAAELGEQIVTKAGGPLVQTHCAHYKHNSVNCTFASSADALMSVTFFRKIVLLIVIVSSSITFRKLLL